MRNLLFIILAILLLGIGARADGPVYYYGGASGVAIINDDTLCVYRHYVIFDDPKLSIGETRGVFKCDSVFDGFYKLSQIPDRRDTPFHGEYHRFHKGHVYNGKPSDSILVKFSFPQRDGVDRLTVSVITEDTIFGAKENADYYNPSGQQYFEVMLPKKYRSFKCAISPYNALGLESVTENGLFLGKIKLVSPALEFDPDSLKNSESVDICFPAIDNSSFAYMYLPESYIYLDRDGFVWMGQQWKKDEADNYDF